MAVSLLCLLSVPFVAPVASQTVEVPYVVATYAYEGPSSVAGQVEGFCDARGLDFPRGRANEVQVGTAGGTIELRRTRVNYTVLPLFEGNGYVESGHQMVEHIEVPAGDVRLTTDPRGVLAIYSRLRPLEVELDSKALNLSAVALGVQPSVKSWWGTSSDGGLSVVSSGYGGWNRRVDFSGLAEASGPLRAYVRESRVEFANGTLDLGPYKVEESNSTVAGVGKRTLIFTDAFVWLNDASFVVPSHATLVCGGLHARVDGSYAASTATGLARTDRENRTFEGRVLTLQGAFSLDETPQEKEVYGEPRGWIQAYASGRVRILGIDFAPVVIAAPGPVVDAAALTLAALLVIAAAMVVKNLGSLVGLLYSRFGPHNALRNRNREMIYQAIREDPGVDLSEVSQRMRFHVTTVAYHVQVLRRVGLVATLRHGRSVRVLPNELMNPRDRARVLVQRDPVLHYIVTATEPQGTPMRDMVRRLSQEFGVTARAAHQAVRRAIAAGVVRRSDIDSGPALYPIS